MSNLNDVHIITGIVTADPTQRTPTNTSRVTNFSVAVDKSYYKDGKERVERTKFYRAAAWNKIGDRIYNRLKKGDLVTITGDVNSDAWKAKDSDEIKHEIVVTVLDYNLLRRGKNHNGDGNAQTEESESEAQDRAMRQFNIFDKEVEDNSVFALDENE